MIDEVYKQNHIAKTKSDRNKLYQIISKNYVCIQIVDKMQIHIITENPFELIQ